MRICLLACFIAFTGSAQAQSPAPLITNVAGRYTTSLNGRWQIMIDPYEAGFYDYQHKPRRDGYFMNTKPSASTDLVE